MADTEIGSMFVTFGADLSGLQDSISQAQSLLSDFGSSLTDMGASFKSILGDSFSNLPTLDTSGVTDGVTLVSDELQSLGTDASEAFSSLTDVPTLDTSGVTGGVDQVSEDLLSLQSDSMQAISSMSELGDESADLGEKLSEAGNGSGFFKNSLSAISDGLQGLGSKIGGVVSGPVNGFMGAMGSLGSNLPNLGSAMGNVASAVGDGLAGAFGAAAQGASMLGSQLVDSINLAQKHQTIMDQTTRTLSAAGAASGITAQSVSKLAESFSQNTKFSEDTIQSGENLLLTFNKIGSQTLPGATSAMLDMSQALGINTTKAAKDLGKALEDPLKAVKDLAKEHINLTAAQQQSIKTMMAHNDVAGAQKVILQAVQGAFGGAAQAAGKTFAGQMQILNNTFDDVKTKIGTALLPIINQFASAVGSVVLPIVQRFSDWVGNTAVPVIQSFGDTTKGIFQTVSTWGSKLGDALGAINTFFAKFSGSAQYATPIIAGLGIAIAASFVPTIWSAAAGVIAATWPFLALAAAIGGVTLIFQHFYNSNAGFKSFIDGLVNGLKQVWTTVSTNFMPVMQQVGEFMQSKVMPILSQVGQFLVSTFKPVWDQLVATFKTQLLPAWDQLTAALQPAMPLFQFIAGIIVGVLILAIGLLIGAFTGLAKGLAGMLPGIIKVFGGIVQAVSGALQFILGIAGFFTDLFTGHFNKLGGDLKNIWGGILMFFSGIWNGIAGVFQAAWGLISGIVSGFIQGVISFFTHLWDELVGHSIIPDMINAIVSWFVGLPGRTMAGIQSLLGSLGAFFQQCWTAITSVFAGIGTWFSDRWTDIVNGFNSVLGGLGTLASNIWNSVTGAVKAGFNYIISLVNGVISHIDSIQVAGFGVNIPLIPYLASGVENFVGGLAVVGEKGPELVELPRGANVINHDKTASLFSGMSMNNNFKYPSAAAQASFSPQIIVQVHNDNPAPIYIDGHELTNSMAPHIANMIRLKGDVRSR